MKSLRSITNLAGSVLTSEIDNLAFDSEGPEGSYTIELSKGQESIIRYKAYRSHKDQTIPILLMGELIASILDFNDTPADTFTLKITYPNSAETTKEFNAIRCKGLPQAGQFDTLHNFLTQAEFIVIPYSSANAPIFAPKIHALSSSNTTARLLKTTGELTEIEPRQTAKNIYTYTINALEPDADYSLTLGMRTMYIKVRQILPGIAFMFRNAFGLEEYFYLTAKTTVKDERESTEAEIYGYTETIALKMTRTFSVTDDNANNVMARQAMALCASDKVELIEDPAAPKEFGENIPVIITDADNETNDDPAGAAKISFKFKLAKI